MGSCPWLADEDAPAVLPLRQAIAANARVIREELPTTARAVVANLLG
ncbi:MAG: hypothetical protein HC857_13225 [Synechococcales cyanobacterium RU_4_20]|nr:hypothetical protein [Synechococcales cyanobacterium RU_4_20]NJR70872.1 hypothetical protein [Synechococcales cyanobacterium CRU_2_2]